MTATIVIDRRFCGPPESANGGYACGALAAYVEDPAEVRLSAPPPLDRPLQVQRADDGVELVDGDALVARARTVADLDLEPPVVSLAEAEAATAASKLRAQPDLHVFPTCFVCGTAREPGDGFRHFCGPVPGRDGVAAAPWVPDTTLDTGDGTVAPVFAWSVLDCTSGAGGFDPTAATFEPHVLGTMAADLAAAVRVGEPYIAVGWKLGASGRKLETAAALLTPNGECVGVGRAVWIRLG